MLVDQCDEPDVLLQLLTGIHDPKLGEAVDQAVPSFRLLVQMVSVGLLCIVLPFGYHSDQYLVVGGYPMWHSGSKLSH